MLLPWPVVCFVKYTNLRLSLNKTLFLFLYAFLNLLLTDLLCVVNCQVLPQEVLVLESGELTELGRSYVAPRVLLDALSVVCSSASQWGDPAEAENLAMEILIVSHHPSIGMGMSYSPEYKYFVVVYHNHIDSSS